MSTGSKSVKRCHPLLCHVLERVLVPIRFLRPRTFAHRSPSEMTNERRISAQRMSSFVAVRQMLFIGTNVGKCFFSPTVRPVAAVRPANEGTRRQNCISSPMLHPFPHITSLRRRARPSPFVSRSPTLVSSLRPKHNGSVGTADSAGSAPFSPEETELALPFQSETMLRLLKALL